MASPSYTLSIPDKRGYPQQIDYGDRKHSRLKRWINYFYGGYSERIICRNSFKMSVAANQSVVYNSKTWGTKAMRTMISAGAEALAIQETPCDNYPLMPGSAAEHLFSRLASYIVSKRRYLIHNCLMGQKSRNLAPHIFLEEAHKENGIPREQIYEIWLEAMGSEEWESQCCSVAEYWRYGRFFAKIGRKSLRIELWYDSRAWAPRTRLATINDYY